MFATFAQSFWGVYTSYPKSPSDDAEARACYQDNPVVSGSMETALDKEPPRPKQKLTMMQRFQELIVNILTSMITGAMQTILCPFIGHAILRSSHLQGYDAPLPSSLAIGALGGSITIGMAFTYNYYAFSKGTTVDRSRMLLLIFMIVVGAGLTAAGCALAQVMLHHVLPHSLDKARVAIAGILGYTILVSPWLALSVIMINVL